MDAECTQLRQQLREAEEKVEDLEFRILELEENPPADEQPDHHDLCERDHQPLQSCSLDKEDQDDKNHLENVESCGITFQVRSMMSETKLFALSCLCDNIDTIMAALTAIVLVFPAW